MNQTRSAAPGRRPAARRRPRPARASLLLALLVALAAIALGPGAGAQPSQTAASSRVVWAAVEEDLVYRSTDGGEHWVAASKGLPRGGVEALCPLLVNRSAPQVAYVVMTGNLYKTTDGGQSWRRVFRGVGCGDGGTVAIDPRQPQLVYVSGNGLFRSRDGGGHWQDLGARLCEIPRGYCAPRSAAGTPDHLLVDPRNANVMYGFWHGVSKSTDGGRTWYPTWRPSGVKSRCASPFEYTHICSPTGLALVLDPRHPSVLYAGEESGGGSVYKSTDAGRNWVQVRRKLYVHGLAVDPKHSNVVWAAGFTSGLGALVVDKSTDGGRTWVTKLRKPRSSGDCDFLRLAIDPGSPSTVYVGCAGVLKTTDGGATWAQKNSGLPREPPPIIDALAVE